VVAMPKRADAGGGAQSRPTLRCGLMYNKGFVVKCGQQYGEMELTTGNEWRQSAGTARVLTNWILIICWLSLQAKRK